jgi:phage baseplate assembly protein W
VASKLYNQTTVATNTASIGDINNGAFVYKGFSTLNNSNNTQAYDINLVKQDLINHFYIRKGEKLENPAFGTIIWDMLFEPMTPQTKKLIADDVQAIVNYDPRMQVNSVSITSTDMGIQIAVNLTYLPFNVNEQMTLNFDKTNAILV